MTDNLAVTLTVFLIIACIFCSSFLLIAAGHHVSFPGELAEIEQLRSDAKRVDIKSNEDVMGKVVETNMLIKSSQAFNKIPVICLAVPNGWDDIELIEIE